MKTLTLTGIVGWDILSVNVDSALKESNGEDITIFLDSCGGSVYEGFKIFNLLKNYSGKVTTVLSGICASMGSYIPLASKEVQIEKNAVFMIHNPWNLTIGDYRDMEKAAEILKGLGNLLAQEYVTKTGKSQKEIKDLLDNESWFFGQQIIDSGFADKIYEGKIESNKDNKKKEDEEEEDYKSRIKAMVQVQIHNAQDKIKELDSETNIKSILNLYKDNRLTKTDATKSVKVEVQMDKEKVKAEHPEIYKAIFEEGVQSEKNRVDAHLAMAEVSTELVIENIKTGAMFSDQKVQAGYLNASIKKGVKKEVLNKIEAKDEKDAPDVVPPVKEDPLAVTKEQKLLEEVLAIVLPKGAK